MFASNIDSAPFMVLYGIVVLSDCIRTTTIIPITDSYSLERERELSYYLLVLDVAGIHARGSVARRRITC